MQSVVVKLERYGYTVSHMDELTTFEQGLKADIQCHLHSSVHQVSTFKEAVAAAEAFEEADLMSEHHPRVLPHCYLPLIPSSLSATNVFSQIFRG